MLESQVRERLYSDSTCPTRALWNFSRSLVAILVVSSSISCLRKRPSMSRKLGLVSSRCARAMLSRTCGKGHGQGMVAVCRAYGPERDSDRLDVHLAAVCHQGRISMLQIQVQDMHSHSLMTFGIPLIPLRWPQVAQLVTASFGPHASQYHAAVLRRLALLRFVVSS